LITGPSDDDLSGIATYSQTGAQFGYAMCWVTLFCFPLTAAIQEISACMGRTTERGQRPDSAMRTRRFSVRVRTSRPLSWTKA
jgi:Mn2+/Fe2+ NRAMP family transporter